MTTKSLEKGKREGIANASSIGAHRLQSIFKISIHLEYQISNRGHLKSETDTRLN